jgi:hypothetical protein
MITAYVWSHHDVILACMVDGRLLCIVYVHVTSTSCCSSFHACALHQIASKRCREIQETASARRQQGSTGHGHRQHQIGDKIWMDVHVVANKHVVIGTYVHESLHKLVRWGRRRKGACRGPHQMWPWWVRPWRWDGWRRGKRPLAWLAAS